MNERIKELARQTTEEVMRNTPSFLVTNDMWQQKFAELIVRECIEVVKWTPSQFPNGECVKNIKAHFGVEE